MRTDKTSTITKLSFYGEEPVLYVGVAKNSREGEVATGADTESESKNLTSYVFEYSSEGKLLRTLTSPNSIDAHGMYKLAAGFYAADQPYGFSIYHSDENKLRPVYSLADMSSWAIVDGTAYVVADGVLYEFKPRIDGTFSLRSLFSSSEITISGLYSGREGILLTGLTDTSSDAPLNIYQLLDQKEEADEPSKNTNNNSGNQSRQRTTVAEPTYTGFDDLLYYGISSFQITNLRFALSSYISSSNTPISSLKITDVAPEPHDRFSESTVSVINFSVVLDNTTTLKAKMEYFDLSAIRLYLFDANNGAQLYDSQVINHKE